MSESARYRPAECAEVVLNIRPLQSFGLNMFCALEKDHHLHSRIFPSKGFIEHAAFEGKRLPHKTPNPVSLDRIEISGRNLEAYLHTVIAVRVKRASKNSGVDALAR